MSVKRADAHRGEHLSIDARMTGGAAVSSSLSSPYLVVVFADRLPFHIPQHRQEIAYIGARPACSLIGTTSCFT